MKGEKLKEIIKNSGMKQKDVASCLGISTSALTQQFSSDDIRTGTLEKLCDVLSITINEVYKGTPYYVEQRKENVLQNDNGDSMNTWLRKQYEECRLEIKNMREDYRKQLQEKDDLIRELLRSNNLLNNKKENLEKTGS